MEIIVGRLTKDAEVKTTPTGRQVVNFSVAVNDSYKAKGAAEVTKMTTYFDCSYWTNPGIGQYLTKGTLVELNGRTSVNAYISGNGEAKASLRLHVNSIKLHGGGNSATRAAITERAQPIAGELTEPLEDLPF